jgi:hypothetical protein
VRLDLLGLAVVHHVGGKETDSRMPVLPVVPGEEPAGECLSIRKRPEPIREVWSVLERLEQGFRVRVVKLVCGRLWVLVMPCRPVGQRQSWSAWRRHGLLIMSCPGRIRCLCMVSPIRWWASSALSRSATTQSTTYRLKMSMMTYK